MDITILHDPLSAASRDFLADIGVTIPDGKDVTVTIGDDSVRIISDHIIAFKILPAFPGYPIAIVTKDSKQNVYAFPKTWSKVIDFAVGSTLLGAQLSAVKRVRQACNSYIYSFYSVEKQLNIGHDEAARATAPPPDPETMYTHDDFLRMHEFKNEARTICNAACAEIKTTQSVAEVEAILKELEHLYGSEGPNM